MAFDAIMAFWHSFGVTAVLVIADKVIFDDGAIQEIVVWQVPTPVPPTEHGFKYRLFYGFPGQRLIGYDNERGKGDHRHREGVEEPYHFRGWEELIDDFLTDVARMRRRR
ncbi:toxin-antitoxin system TumE family protein [Methylobacterium brachiatum]|jgi:hypothetical protein|uniref:toxin-antitoxin system TumE family protein n=1 Tax=Methylobacterium brachiatum TaxID=269660 RepID=UPI0008F0856E|nr:DUF6516 family protein [Methylobacterium brachiatum]SFI41559.1 hypothetical protein SAMN02799642_01778 [Methylobacterium brachiatum]